MVAGDASSWRGRGNTPDLAISLCLLRGRRLAAEVLLVLLLQVALHVEVVLHRLLLQRGYQRRLGTGGSPTLSRSALLVIGQHLRRLATAKRAVFGRRESLESLVLLDTQRVALLLILEPNELPVGGRLRCLAVTGLI